VYRCSDPLNGVVSSILIFGNQLLALTEDGRRLVVWNTETMGEWHEYLHLAAFAEDVEEIQTTISFSADFTATSMLHPATYLNKILVASTQGAVQLWNIRSE
jgi:U3 small nucleolar RNA-associated protein 21